MGMSLWQQAWSGWIPAADSDLVLPVIELISDSGEILKLPGSFTNSEKALILVPLFTQCRGACPVLIEEVLRVWPEIQIPAQVLLFSFDSEDTIQILSEYREMKKLPRAWFLAGNASNDQIRTFFQKLSFDFRKTSNGFDHPNSIFVFSPQGFWSGTLVGLNQNAQEFDKALRLARAREGNWFGKIEVFFSNWQNLAILGFLGLTFSLGGSFLWLILRRRGPKAVR